MFSLSTAIWGSLASDNQVNFEEKRMKDETFQYSMIKERKTKKVRKRSRSCK